MSHIRGVEFFDNNSKLINIQHDEKIRLTLRNKRINRLCLYCRADLVELQRFDEMLFHLTDSSVEWTDEERQGQIELSLMAIQTDELNNWRRMVKNKMEKILENWLTDAQAAVFFFFDFHQVDYRLSLLMLLMLVGPLDW